MTIEKTEEEIQEVIDRAREHQEKFDGMTYQEGIVYALEWILGVSDSDPMEE